MGASAVPVQAREQVSIVLNQIDAGEIPPAVDAQFATVAALDQKMHVAVSNLSHAEQQRVEAETWKIQNGFDKRMLKAFRSANDLDGLRAYFQRKLDGEVSSGPNNVGSSRIRWYRGILAAIQAENARRDAGGERIPLSGRAAPTSARRQLKQSPGRPLNSSRRPVPMRRLRNDEKEAA
jgi:hypothetical protein